MIVINWKWTPKINMLLVKCECNNKFWHRADKIKIKCQNCGKIDNCFDLKNRPVHLERRIKNVKID